MGSILNDTKKMLGLAEDYTAFDLDVITNINAALSITSQLGVGPSAGFFIEDEFDNWEDMGLPPNQQHLLRTYVFLKVRLVFDPPSTSYLITLANEQVAEYENRLNLARELALDPFDPMTGAAL